MTIRTEKDGPVWTVINSRPEARNAVDFKASEALFRAFQDFERDETASVAVFWGEGGAFCAGWDLKRAAELTGAAPLSHYEFGAEDEAASQAPMGPSRLQLSKPVIAAIAGPAVAGGMELALWCDFRVMEKSAYMGVYCRRWGVPLIDGGTVRLPRLVGQGRAMELVLTGRKVEAEEALRIGLCEHVVPDGEARRTTEALAHDIARFPQTCLRADRASVLRQQGLPLADALRQEWAGGQAALKTEGIAGAGRFAGGQGRHGLFTKADPH